MIPELKTPCRSGIGRVFFMEGRQHQAGSAGTCQISDAY